MALRIHRGLIEPVREAERSETRMRISPIFAAGLRQAVLPE
jgi:hypothetical protein